MQKYLNPPQKAQNCSQIINANKGNYLFLRSNTYYLRKRINTRDVKQCNTSVQKLPSEIKFSLGTSDTVVAIAAAKLFSELVKHFAYSLKSQNPKEIKMATLVIKAKINKLLSAMNLASEDEGQTLSTKSVKHLRLDAENEFSAHLKSREVMHDINGIPFKSGVKQLVRRKQCIGRYAQAQHAGDFDKELKLARDLEQFAKFKSPDDSRTTIDNDPQLATLLEAKKLYLIEEFGVDWERWTNCTTYRADKDNDRAKKLDEAITETIFYLENKPVHKYTRLEFKGLFKSMERMPKYRAKRFRHLSLTELEAEAWTAYKDQKGQVKDITLSFSTIDKYRQKIRQFFRWIMEQLEDDQVASNLIRNNPVPSKLHKSKNKSVKNKSWASFTPKDLSEIWQSHGFIEAQHDWQYWLPIILRATGARPNEIAQLRVCDVYVEKVTLDEASEVDMYFLKVTDSSVFQSVKNDTSKRNIPIHPLVLELGFADFVQHQIAHKKPQQLLWNGLKMRGGYYATNFRNWFSEKVLGNSAIIPERFDEDGCKKVLYSFRSTYVTSFSEQKLSKAILQQLIGHVDQEHALITNRYTKTFQRELMYKELCKYEMPDIKALVQAIPSITIVKAR